MAGLQIPQVLVVLGAIVALNFVSAKPRDIIFPSADESLPGNPESAAYPPSLNDQSIKTNDLEDKPKNCFHFYVSRNMSSLLAEATKMLRAIRDRREREWILTFIYRIKSLAEHLRAHPNSRNYDCLPSDEETKKRLINDNARGQPQPELYFVDDIPKRSEEGEDILDEADEAKASDNQEISNTSPVPAQPLSHVLKDAESDIKPPPSQTLSSAETASDNTLTDSNDEEKDIPTSKLDAAAESPSNEDSAQKDNDENSSVKEEKTEGDSIILSSVRDCDSNSKCKNNDNIPPSEKSQEKFFADAGNIYPLKDDFHLSVSQDEKALEQLGQQKEEIKDDEKELKEAFAMFEKVKKIARLEGGLDWLKKSGYIIGADPEDAFRKDASTMTKEEKEEADFDYEEIGAAVGDLNLNDNVHPDRTVAPSLDEVQNSKEHSNHPKDSAYEPYDDSDILVQQLFDVRNSNNNNMPSKSTKPFNDQNNDYLITSTHTPL